MNDHGKPWQTQKMSILNDMTLCTDLKIDPVYLNNIPALKPDSNDIRGYNAILNRIPVEDRKRMREIYADRGKAVQQFYSDKKQLLKLKYQWYLQDYLSCVASVDENIGRILDYLDKNKLADNTIVIYTSDQGMYLGENGWFDKRWMYDVSMQSPLLIRWPEKIKAGSVNSTMVQNIDYAPTFLDIAGIKVPDWMQGISIKSVLLGKQPVITRKNLYYHYYEYPFDHSVVPHLGIRGERYKLIYFYTINEWELYDLKIDSQEQKNLIKSLTHQKIFLQMKAELLKLRNQYDDHEIAGELH
jgi:arylsulfatase A-like enzyme